MDDDLVMQGAGAHASAGRRRLVAVVAAAALAAFALAGGSAWGQADGSGATQGAVEPVQAAAGRGSGSGTSAAAGSPAGPAGAGLGSGGATAPGGQAAADLSHLDFHVDVPSGPLTVGDPIDVTLRVELPAGVALGGVDTVDPGRLEFLDRHIDTRPAAGGATSVAITSTFVAYRAGHHVIGGFDLVCLQPDGTTVRVHGPGAEVVVQSVIANEQDPELKPPKEGVVVRYRNYTLAWAAGIGVSFLGLLAFVYLMARNRPRAIKLPPPLPPRPAHEVALEKLDAIRAEELIEKGQVMAFHVRLSEAVREYLGLRYGFDGLEMTTTEMLAQLDDKRLPTGTSRTAIGHLLYACDLVKFARHGAEAGEEQGLLEQAYDLVHVTTPRPEPPPAAPAGEGAGAGPGAAGGGSAVPPGSAPGRGGAGRAGSPGRSVGPSPPPTTSVPPRGGDA